MIVDIYMENQLFLLGTDEFFSSCSPEVGAKVVVCSVHLARMRAWTYALVCDILVSVV